MFALCFWFVFIKVKLTLDNIIIEEKKGGRRGNFKPWQISKPLHKLHPVNGVLWLPSAGKICERRVFADLQILLLTKTTYIRSTSFINI